MWGQRRQDVRGRTRASAWPRYKRHGTNAVLTPWNMLRHLVSLILSVSLVIAPVHANWCAAPGRDGTTGLSGVLNTYFPGTADVSAGSTSISIGPATGAMQSISAGDLLLVIQMQDATIATNNNSRYGDSVSGGYGSGYSGIQQTGRYEYVRATNSVGPGGGTLTIQGATGSGLGNSYNHADPIFSWMRKQSFQVVRVPQYVDATISGTVTAAPWNGSSGGIVAIDVAGRLTFSGGTISVAERGFRGGGGRSLSGGSASDTDYRTMATTNAHASKGEGIAGTPRYVNDNGSLLNTGYEGYISGSYARGAPGNAGGGGTDGNPSANDQNSGGGGGGNAGAGGQGGHAWCPSAPSGCDPSGGHPGDQVSEQAVDRLVMGGGGGAGTTNNATGSPSVGFASSGAAGGGIVLVRAGEIAGSGSIDANGADANSTVENDGTGGGGAGGTVLVSAVRSIGGASLSIAANGGDGGSNTGTGVAHGPGGGGGGGFIASTSTIATSASVFGGSAGITQNGGGFGANYGATAGNAGTSTLISAASIPGMSSGGECTPTITKSFATSPIISGGASQMSVTLLNNNPSTAITGLAFNDSYPAGLINTLTPSPTKSCTTAGTLTATAGGNSFVVSGATIDPGASCSYSVNTTVNSSGDKTNLLAAGGITWNYGTNSHASLTDVAATISVAPPLTIVKSSQAYLDPQNGTTNPKLIPGGFVAYTVTVANPGGYTVTTDSIIIVDATPANLSLFVGNVPGGTGPVLFQDGSPSSALSYTFASLSSTTDDVDFSSDGGATWTYTPVPNASQVDPNVTHMRIRPKGAMASDSSFNLLFGYLIG